jgi:ribosomal protein S18 acetylase RimI-like enzyme
VYLERRAAGDELFEWTGSLAITDLLTPLCRHLLGSAGMTVTLEPMTPREYDAWRPYAVSGYAQEFIDSGILDPEAASKRAKSDFDNLLADGLATPDQLLWSVHTTTEPAPVGAIWLQLKTDGAASRAFVYSLDIFPAYRRRGFGHTAMELLIEESRRRGARSIGLNVFGHNDTARRIYDRLGFRVTSTNMQLDL